MGYGFAQTKNRSTDGNKNVIALYDTDGILMASYSYGPFGQLLTAEGPLAAVNPFRFSSEYFDDETSLVYYNYRYYSPRLGRWLSRDTIGETGGLNLYGMLGNDAVNKWDKLGLTTLGEKFLAEYAIRYVSDPKHNRSSGRLTFYDDLNELQTSDMIKAIEGKIRESVKLKNVFSDIWKRQKLDYVDLGKLTQNPKNILDVTGYLLNQPAGGAFAEGEYDVRKCRDKIMIKNVIVTYYWYDDIDANSYEETYDRYVRDKDLTEDEINSIFYNNMLENYFNEQCENNTNSDFSVKIIGIYKELGEKSI